MRSRLDDARAIRLIDLDFVAAQFRRDAATRRVISNGWTEMLWEVFVRSAGICVYCQSPDGPFHLDHITPLARGGPHDLPNMALACRHCNNSKTYYTAAEFGRPDIQRFQPATTLDVYMDRRRSRLKRRPTVRHRYRSRS